MKPILFNTEMVRAILEGRKTVTRRVCKVEVDGHQTVKHDRCVSVEYPCKNLYGPCADFFGTNGFYVGAAKQPYHPGDILYVRETWCEYGKLDDSDCLIEGTEKYYYRADGENPTPFNDFLVQHRGWDGHRETPVWHPSIHMPKEAARLFLRVTDVRIERVQDITDEDIVAEGLEIGCYFDNLWDSTIKLADLPRYGWHANPWVWVIEFEQISKEEAQT